MFDLLQVVIMFVWAFVKSAFYLYKQLVGIQNNFWAVALGVSPAAVAIIFFVLKRIKSLTI